MKEVKKPKEIKRKYGKNYKEIIKADPEMQTLEKRRKIYKAIYSLRRHLVKYPTLGGKLLMAFNVNNWDKILNIHGDEIEEVRVLLRKLRSNSTYMTLEERLLDEDLKDEI